MKSFSSLNKRTHHTTASIIRHATSKLLGQALLCELSKQLRTYNFAVHMVVVKKAAFCASQIDFVVAIFDDTSAGADGVRTHQYHYEYYNY